MTLRSEAWIACTGVLQPALIAALLLAGARGGEAPAFSGGVSPPGPGIAPAEESPSPTKEGLRNLDEEPYRTPRAGEGFRTEVFGRKVEVDPRDRRYLNAFSLGFSAVCPGVAGSEILPYGSLYFWRRPDDDTLLRAVALGIYDDVLYTRSTESVRPFEGVLTFQNYTLPLAQSEQIDGHRFDDEELIHGYVRGGIGLGLRKNLEKPGAVDNMASIYLTAEPGYLFFDDGSDTADDFAVPQDTFEIRAHLRGRIDKMERNLMEMTHRGFAIGTDLIYGSRANWENWGFDRSETASHGRDFLAWSGYVVGATPVPWSERHVLIGEFHGGTGSGLDRFSDFDLGGGPSGAEYEAISRPIMPGAIIEECSTDRYAIAMGEYRWEPIFFVYLEPRATVSYVERRRLQGGREGRRTKSDDVLSSIGLRITSGFIWKSQLEIQYDYNFGVIRKDEYGGHGVVVSFSKSF